ncbi:Bacterial SH3 domain protein [Aquimixticola soesokkakensis]|uniref:Bacterial SH3 domain protein n=1 Tax=Aquimixticola soesokkakensis TaxID=1519096 RepID=A0A1Y5SJN4_9RHOB|nr:SH3 domain-containing protein [Aquimixticola soesokkakensis]SLN41700.1 Bacterial SH3 domain protein [Aquimixticola soesokkakensis]
MRKCAILTGLAVLALTGCGAIGGTAVVVSGTGPDDLLKLRAGPGLGYSILMGLPDGTALTRRDCVTEVGQLWCRVSLTDTPDVTGYVAGDYLATR